MFTITEQAAVLIHHQLDEKSDDDQVVMRILMEDGRWSWAVDVPRVNDKIYEYKGTPVVAVRQDVSELLENRTLDIRETEKGAVFVIN